VGSGFWCEEGIDKLMREDKVINDFEENTITMVGGSSARNAKSLLKPLIK
jgi:hypothetical protein